MNASSDKNLIRLNCCNELYNPWDDGSVPDYWNVNTYRRQINYHYTTDYTY